MMFYKVEDHEFGYEVFDENKLREDYERHKDSEAVLDIGTDDETEIRAALLR